MNTWIFNKVEFEADKKNDGLKTSPWSGHRNFAYDLVTYMKPKRIVELGTHYGCSFFSFLQACKDQHLDTEVIAIDCWEGDPQAGFYGDEVFSLVKETVDAFFKKQNKRLIKKYFDEALSDVEDESVDILHIDGLHTYEAVSNDYKNWLPKLKNNGIVLFHDVESSLGYGTNKFWEEMQKINPYNYTFNHSWGLGVLFPKGEKYYEEFEDLNMKDKILSTIEEYVKELSQDKDFYEMSNVKKDKILLSDIMYIDYRAKYISYHMKNGEVKRERKHLHTFMDNVKSEDFIFINKGTIVNMKNTKYVEGYNLMMKNMQSLPISINTIKKVKNQLLEYWNNQNE